MVKVESLECASIRGFSRGGYLGLVACGMDFETPDPLLPPLPEAPHPLEAPEERPLPLPWEDRERYPQFWPRVGAMFSLVFSDPLGYFERVPAGSGLARPWTFQMLLMAPVLVLVGILLAFFGMVGLAATLGASANGEPFPAWIFGLLPALALLFPLFLFLGMVVSGAVAHACLWLWGGLRPGQPVGQSIRAHGYANAFISLFSLIPYFGILVALAGTVWMGWGFARLHRTDTWRGICALLTPLVLICCCGLAAAITVPLVLAARGH